VAVVRDIIDNAVIAQAMERVQQALKKGEGVAAPLRESMLFPPLALHLIAIGEETGQLDSMLLQVADTYDEEVRNAVKRLVALLEPTLILLMGLIVGFIVIAMLVAVFSINEIPI